MSQYDVVLPPGVSSTEVTLNDDVMGYGHNFTLQYIMEDGSVSEGVTMETFSFGKHGNEIIE